MPPANNIEKAELPVSDLKCKDADGHNVYLYVEKEEGSGPTPTADYLTKFLAAWGAILSTFGLGWTFYRDSRDKARLRIMAHVRRVVQSADGKWYAVRPNLPVEGASRQVYVVLDVTNIGRRPVQWSGWGGKYRKLVDGKDSFTIIPVALPRILDERAGHSEYTAELNPANQNVKQIFIWDGSGKNWYLSRRALRKLNQESAKFQAPCSS